MRPQEEYERVLALVDEGLNDCQISRRTGVPRGTVRDWRIGREAGSPGRTEQATGKLDLRAGGPPGRACDGSCGRPEEVAAAGGAYAYLLGQYLGDGTLSRHPKGVYKLRITCTEIYPGIVEEVAGAIDVVKGGGKTSLVWKVGCVEVYSYWKHWPCVFPQHGPGRKHERLIELAPWQQKIVQRHPRELPRGLIHSDGNRHVNEVIRQLKEGPKRYRYSRYMFTNASEDIRRLFTDTLDGLGVQWTQTNPRNVAVFRREDVALLDTFVGPKR